MGGRERLAEEASGAITGHCGALETNCPGSSITGKRGISHLETSITNLQHVIGVREHMFGAIEQS